MRWVKKVYNARTDCITPRLLAHPLCMLVDVSWLRSLVCRLPRRALPAHRFPLHLFARATLVCHGRLPRRESTESRHRVEPHTKATSTLHLDKTLTGNLQGSGACAKSGGKTLLSQAAVLR